MAQSNDDPFDLSRFVAAQDSGGTYRQALAELRRGYKASHWMWFVFPQIAGLGMSAMSQRYAIASLEEARAYLAHDVLGPRLRECAEVVDGLTSTPPDLASALPGSATPGKDGLGRPSAQQIFGGIDAQKLHSSMTLFARAAPGEPVFGQVLDRYFDGVPDSATEAQLTGR